MSKKKNRLHDNASDTRDLWPVLNRLWAPDIRRITNYTTQPTNRLVCDDLIYAILSDFRADFAVTVGVTRWEIERLRQVSYQYPMWSDSNLYPTLSREKRNGMRNADNERKAPTKGTDHSRSHISSSQNHERGITLLRDQNFPIWNQVDTHTCFVEVWPSSRGISSRGW